MKILPRTAGEPIVLRLSPQEFDLLKVGLNELTNYVDADLEASLSADGRTIRLPGRGVSRIWWALHGVEHGPPHSTRGRTSMELRSRDACGSVEIELSGQELYLLRGGFTGLVDRIDDEDLGIRIGVTRQKMQAVVDDLGEVWSGLDETEPTTCAPRTGERWVHDPTGTSPGWPVRVVTSDAT